MTDEPPDPRRIIEDTDWSALTHGGGSASPETPVKLAALVSGDPAAVGATLNHLSDDLLHQGSLYSATVPAARYVAALLADPRSVAALTPAGEGFPLRGKLLGWLAGVAEAAGDAMEQKIQIWFGYSALERIPLLRDVRGLRPELYRAVEACRHDADPRVRRAALLAALYLLDDPALISHREELTPAVESELAASSEQWQRTLAMKTLAVWRGEEPTTVTDDDLWTDERPHDRGPIDDPPF